LQLTSNGSFLAWDGIDDRFHIARKDAAGQWEPWRSVATGCGSLSSDGTWLVQYQPSPRGLERVNTETGKATPIVADEEILPTRLNLSPDGKWVLGLVQRGGEDAERGPSPEMMAWRLRDGAAISLGLNTDGGARQLWDARHLRH